jgi:ABC-type ATPase involved in cell division
VLIATHDTQLIAQARMPVMTLEQGQLRLAA